MRLQGWALQGALYGATPCLRSCDPACPPAIVCAGPTLQSLPRYSIPLLLQYMNHKEPWGQLHAWYWPID